MNRRDDYVMTDLEISLHEAVEKARNKEPNGLLTIYFPSLPQSVVEALADQIEMILEAELNTAVHVDY